MAAEFEGLHDGEKVLLVFRRHIIAMRKFLFAANSDDRRCNTVLDLAD